MTRNPHLPLSIKVAEPPGEKKPRVPTPAPQKPKVNRPPAVYSNKSREDRIEELLKMEI